MSRESRPPWPSSAIVRLSMCSPARICGSRSEEHTSELQSQSNLVCRLLLEKKKHQAASRTDRDRYRYRHLPPARPREMDGDPPTSSALHPLDYHALTPIPPPGSLSPQGVL